ncbi:hypothetical protein [Gynuella sp.]|uniref:hypothetical protein n=1 Tax=Gynuella sp. TaxID=2969146 RepID=UPI003D129A19
MNEAEPRLTLVNTGSVIPREISTLQDWQQRCQSEWQDCAVDLGASLMNFFHSQTGFDPQQLSTYAPETRWQHRFRESDQSIADMAVGALQQLRSERPSENMVCALMLLCTNAFDDSQLYRSIVTQMAAETGNADQNHFAVSQMQGAALGTSLDIIKAMVPDAGQSALLVASERWMLPFSRFMPSSPPLADGAVALWFEQQSQPDGLVLLGQYQSQKASFVEQGPVAIAGNVQVNLRRDVAPIAEYSTKAVHSELSFAIDNMTSAVSEAIAACLDQLRLTTDDIDLWLPSGLDAEVDEQVLQQLTDKACYDRNRLPDDGGYLCAASTPLILSHVLNDWRQGKIKNNTYLLSWGLSWSGCVCVQVWQTQGNPLCN